MCTHLLFSVNIVKLNLLLTCWKTQENNAAEQSKKLQEELDSEKAKAKSRTDNDAEAIKSLEKRIEELTKSDSDKKRVCCMLHSIFLFTAVT